MLSGAEAEVRRDLELPMKRLHLFGLVMLRDPAAAKAEREEHDESHDAPSGESHALGQAALAWFVLSFNCKYLAALRAMSFGHPVLQASCHPTHRVCEVLRVVTHFRASDDIAFALSPQPLKFGSGRISRLPVLLQPLDFRFHLKSPANLPLLDYARAPIGEVDRPVDA
jgi:hypothetical protein